MICNRYHRYVALDVEGDLPAKQARHLARHFDHCPACRQFGTELKQSQDSIKKLTSLYLPQETSDGFQGRVRQAIAQERHRQQRRWHGWRRLLPAGATLLFLVGAFAWFTMRGADSALGREAAAPAYHHAPALEAEAITLTSAPKEEAPPVMIKILTGNPDVVIYWLGSNQEVPHEQSTV